MTARTIASRFAERVQGTPGATALVCEGTRLSYAELDAASNRFARHLRRRGARPETVVALHLEHGLLTFVALLGVVKSGAAYLALAPSDPPARTRQLLTASGATIVVTDSPDVERGAWCLVHRARDGFNGSTIRVPEDIAAIDAETADPLAPLAGPANLFQIVYTSGSTGQPKGVLVPMTAMLNRLDGMASRYPFTPDDVALLHRPLSIIGSSWDCFGPLIAGIPTVIVRNFDPGVPAVWRQLREHRVSHLAAAPSMWELVLDRVEQKPGEWDTLRLAIVGGQTIDPGLVRRWKAAFPRGILLNVYGASECVYPAAADVSTLDDTAERVPAGSAFPHVQVHVLDDRFDRVAAGTSGEICIGGACLARGYLADAALTAERFVPDPYSLTPGAVLFRTGDVGFRTSDDILQVIGRRDRQVKVHGFRVDLGEVEAALRRCERVAAAAVVARPDGRGDNRLAAYVVTTDGVPLHARDVRATLASIVPGHMLPASIVTLAAMPLTRSGKIDLQRLAAEAPADIAGATTAAAASGDAASGNGAHDARRLDGHDTSPVSHVRVRQEVRSPEAGKARTGTREARWSEASLAWLCRTFEEVLGAAGIGPSDNFFDLGGDSLAAMRVAARIRQALNRDVDVSVILEAESVGRLAELLGTPEPALAIFNGEPVKE